MITEGEVLWNPTPERRRAANISDYLSWLERQGRSFDDYSALWEWSVTDLEDFWGSVWSYFDILSPPYESVLKDRRMPGAQWFPGARLNYVQQVFRNRPPTNPALLYAREDGHPQSMSWATLEDQVARLAHTFRMLGLEQGDRVAAYLPNVPETVVAFLATASLGAIWSVCSPDFGAPSVIDRFRQIEPTLLIVGNGYHYQGKIFDRRSQSQDLIKALPTVSQVLMVDTLQDGTPGSWGGQITWEEALKTPAPLDITPVPFDHPLWILYSSGTTGLPKPIVHGHGGMLLTHLVSGAWHMDIHPSDRFFWFTTTGWMMWNIVVSSLLVGATAILYDGSPSFPAADTLWKFAEETQMTVFGTSAAYLHGCLKAGMDPGRRFDLSHLQAVGSTGSPLSPEGFVWVYEHVKSDLWLAPASGGTDICSPLVGGVPILPVRAGEMQCRILGVKVEAYTPEGQPVIDQVGELVVSEPMPSMPLYLWGDSDFHRYQASYFSVFPGLWRHGDFIRITRTGGAVIYGRSDATINRFGVRFGSADIYRAVDQVDAVAECLVVDLEALGRPSYMILFVKMSDNRELDDAVRETINSQIRQILSPRHVPDEIVAVTDIPKTLNGKKMEVPVRKLLLGQPEHEVLSRDAMSNPECIDEYVAIAVRLKLKGQS